MRKLTDITIKRFPIKKNRLKLPGFVLLLVVCAVVADVAFFSFAPYTSIYPAPTTQEPPTADACAVLFNDFNDNFTGINEETARRVEHGIALFKQGKVQHLIMAGGVRKELKKYGSTLMAEYAQGKGIPQNAILVDSKSYDSFTNLANIQAIMASNHLQNLILISSTHHLARIKRIGLGRLTKNCTLSPYNPFSAKPAISRFELWGSIHRNLIAEMLWRMMPATSYKNFVIWVRTHTSF